MSCANPTSTESAVGVDVADDPGRPVSRPAAAPNSSNPTAASTAISGRAQPLRSAGGSGGASGVRGQATAARGRRGGHGEGAGGWGATVAGVRLIAGCEPGVPGDGAATNGGGLSWSKAP